MKTLNCFYWTVKLLPVFDVVMKLSEFDPRCLRAIGAQEAPGEHTLIT